MTDAPIVSVLMPVYNGEQYIVDSVESILDQSFCDFELIVVNDGSTDNTANILEYYQKLDQRVRVYTQANRGIAGARATAWRLAEGKYIAWCDADDVARPQRLATQLSFLEDNQHVGICGTWVETIGEPAGLIWQYPIEDADIRCRLLFESPLATSSVMMRRMLFVQHKLDFDSTFPPAEDYDLWVKASFYCQFANVGEILVLYRSHRTQSTRLLGKARYTNAHRVRLRQLDQLKLQVSVEESELHQALSEGWFDTTKEFIIATEKWLIKVQNANRCKAIYPSSNLSKVLGERWLLACRAAAGQGWWTWRTFWRSPLSQDAGLSPRQRFNFLIRCSLRQPA